MEQFTTDRNHGSHGGGSLDQWSRFFLDQKSHSYAREDVPFWRVLNIDYAPTAADIINELMNRRCPTQERGVSQDVVRGFCRDVDLTVLGSGTGPPSHKALALLDDRNRDDDPEKKEGNVRKSRGALTACQLYQELLQKVFMLSTYST